SAAQFSVLFASFPDGVFLFDCDGVIVSPNTALSSMTGIDIDTLSSMTVPGLFPDEIMSGITGSGGKQRKRKDIRLETVCSRNGGSDFPVELSVVYTGASVDIEGMCIVRDISVERAHSTENRVLKDRLRHSQTMETMGQLAGGISHYFNNVFTGILGNLSLAETEVPEKHVPLIRKTSVAADRARGLTRRILSLSRTQKIVPEPIDLVALIDDVETFARLSFDRHIEIDVRISGDLPGVLADAAAIHHVILNLCVNARDTIEEKHLNAPDAETACITIDVAPYRVDKSAAGKQPAHTGRFVKVTVTDTGCGIDDDLRERLFEPFYTTKEAGKGTGLGLATAREIIEEHGGWMELDSMPGKGSSFSFYLPTVTLAKSVADDNQTNELPTGTESVFVVDDDEMVRGFAVMALERLGYSVCSATDGREALDMFITDNDEIDLVVLDLGLPVLPGRTVLEKMRQIDSDVKVIISTGHDFEQNRSEYDELRALDYILKPFTINDLALSVRNSLDRKK
ncbi:ATP-binding protein, partial [Candidatus Latescibacterota bacterium]